MGTYTPLLILPVQLIFGIPKLTQLLLHLEEIVSSRHAYDSLLDKEEIFTRQGNSYLDVSYADAPPPTC